MIRNIFLTSICILGLALTLDTSFAESVPVFSITNCNGTRVVRTDIGKLEISHVGVNTKNCIGAGISEARSEISATGADIPSPSGSGVNALSSNQSQSGNMVNTGEGVKELAPKFNPENGPAFDIRSTDTVNYRVIQMKNKGIRYVDPMRSVKVRDTPSMLARVAAYLMKNDSVVITGKEIGWVSTQGADVLVTDTISNTILPDTTGKSDGYIASKYLRLPNASDLVRIRQADQAYWSDIAHVKVAHLVNVRLHPWYGAQITATLTDTTQLYIVSTVDNWSEVISDDRSISGYIRSDFLVVDTAQRIDR